MKTRLFAALAVLVVAAAGCSKDLELKENYRAENLPDGMVQYTFTVSNPNKDVKSTLTDAGVFGWTATNDKIAIYNSATSSYVEFTVTSVDGSGNATITGTAAPGASWTNAIYPAERATGAGNGVDYTVSSVSGPILVSKVTGGSLSFKYLGAVINVKVSGVPDSPTTITFTANTDVFGSRTFSWSGDSPVLGGTATQASITVPFTEATTISIPIPQVEYSGFTITVDNAAGRHLYKKTTASTADMRSKKLLPMPALTYEAPTKFYVKTTSATGYWDSQDFRMIQTGSNSYDLSLNCDGNSTYYIYDEYNMDQRTAGYLATGLAKSTFSTGDSHLSIIGDVNGNNWSWESLVPLQYEGDWHYVRNITFDNIQTPDGESSYCHFLIVEGSSWETCSHKYGAADVYPGGYGSQGTDSASWDFYAKNITAGTCYDLFFNTSTYEIRVFLSSANHDPNEASGVWKLSFNNSTGVATHTWKSSTQNNPFGDASFPTTDYGFKSDFDGYSSVHNSSTSYSNLSWVIGDITVDSADTKEFGLCNGSSGYWTDICTSGDVPGTVAPGGNLYGTLTYWSDTGTHTNPSVTLAAGDYLIYANVNPDVNGGINLMFEKQ